MMKTRPAGYPTGVKFRLFQASVLSLALLLGSVSVVGSTLKAYLGEEFSTAPMWLLSSFITFPTIGNMLANLVGGATATKIGKKNICLLGCVLSCVFGILPFWLPSLEMKIASRVVASLGIGLIQPLSASLIVDCFDDKTASIMMGIQSAFVGLGRSIFSYTIAAIMVYNWHFGYFAHLYAVVVFILVMIFVPEFVNELGRNKEAGAEKAQEVKAAPKASGKLPAAAYVGLLGQLFFMLGYNAVNVCIMTAAVSTGNITQVQAAALVGFGGIAQLVAGLVFGVIKNRIGMTIGPIALICVIAGELLIAFTGTLNVWYVGIALVSIGFCWWMPFINLLVNTGTDASNSARANSMGFFGNSFGSFMFAYVMAFIGGFFGEGGINEHQAFLYGAVWVFLALIVVVGYLTFGKKKTA